MLQSRQRKIIKSAISLLGLIVLFAGLVLLIQELDFVSFIRNRGLLGVFVYTVYVALSGVIVILPVVPLWPAVLLAYGYFGAVFFSWIGSIAGAAVCFFIARRFGREIVVKLVSRKALSEAESVLEINNPRSFLVLRLLASNYFDTVSYVAGLSTLAFKPFIILSAIASLLWHGVIFAFMYRFANLQNTRAFLGMFGVYGLIILSVSIIWKVRRKNLKSK